MTFRSLLFLTFTVFAFISARASKTQCRIDFQIKNLENEKIIFACQYGAKQLSIDTIALDSLGNGFYESRQRLIGGIYVIILPSGRYFDVLINNEQYFSIISDTANIMENLIIEGADETDMFRKYQLLTARHEELLAQKKMQNPSFDLHQYSIVEKAIDSLKQACIAKDQKSFISVYFRMQEEPDMPDSLIQSIGGGSKEQFLQRVAYRKANYFKQIDFNDVRILRTRLLHEKLAYYFNVLLPQDGDTICAEMDKLLGQVERLDEQFRYLLNFLNVNYRQAAKPAHEKALVHLADNYYLAGKTPWADRRFVTLLKERADALRPSLTGVKGANLELYKPSGSIIELYKIKAEYLAIIFWSPDCEVCRTEAESLLQLYKKYKSKNFKVLAMYVHADKETWLEEVSKRGYKWINVYDPLMKSNYAKMYGVTTTPKIVLLNKDKVILEKNTNALAIEKYIEGKVK